MQKEAVLENWLRGEARARGGVALKLVPASGAGLPDRLVLLPGGRVAFVELKRPDGGRVSAAQSEWLRRLRALGFAAGVASTREACAALLEAAT